MPVSSRVAARWLVSTAVLLGACADRTPLSPDLGLEVSGTRGPVPAPTVVVTAGGSSTEFFPYLADDLSSSGRDPVNLVFVGESDPRSIRAALMGLDGNRGGSPLAPFDCTWKDAIGGLQTSWSIASGWVGGAIQLECGDYGPIRFHLRLFDLGEHTLGGAHFEFLIPGTTDHQVVSWELAEQLVTFDLARTGRLGAAPGTAPGINSAPSFRTIPAVLYALATQSDPQFAALLGSLGLVDLPGGDKGIPTDGAATVLTLASAAPLVPASYSQAFDVPFGQVIPKPFCTDGAPSPYLYVTGPVHLSLTTTQQAGGRFEQEMTASGRLNLTPVDPATGQPVGATYAAEVTEFQHGRLDGSGSFIQGMQHQSEVPMGGAGRGQLQIKLKVGSGEPQFSRTENCGQG